MLDVSVCEAGEGAYPGSSASWILGMLGKVYRLRAVVMTKADAVAHPLHGQPLPDLIRSTGSRMFWPILLTSGLASVRLDASNENT